MRIVAFKHNLSKKKLFFFRIILLMNEIGFVYFVLFKKIIKGNLLMHIIIKNIVVFNFFSARYCCISTTHVYSN